MSPPESTPRPRTFTSTRAGQRHVWHVERLWSLSRGLVPFAYPIRDCPALDLDCWFGDVHVPTVRRVLAHLERIQAADLDHPVILSETGEVMDGLHRICKAWLAGHPTVTAVQFAVDPAPDRIDPIGRHG